MKHNTLAKQLNMRNFRRRLIADAYTRAKQRAADKQLASVEAARQPALVLVQLPLALDLERETA
jgi:hypothetical protein